MSEWTLTILQSNCKNVRDSGKWHSCLKDKVVKIATSLSGHLPSTEVSGILAAGAGSGL